MTVVGGGVMGLAVARELAGLGARPLLLERRSLGSGSTGKSGAILRQHYSHALTATMARDSLRVFTEFAEWCGGSAGFVRTGMALVVRAADADGLDRNLALQHGLGIRTERLDANALRAAVPGLVADDDVIGCFEPDAGYADPLATIRALAADVERRGGTIRQGAEVAGIRTEGERVRGVRLSSGEVVESDAVVVAAGPWAEQVMQSVGCKTEVGACRVESAVLRRRSGRPNGPVVIDFPNEMYAKDAGETHVGSIAPEEARPADPDDYDESAAHSYVRLAHERVARRLPDMADAVRFGGYAALYAVTPDWHPVIGPAGPDRLYLCAGFSGHGFKLAPAVGRSVAAEVLGDRAPYDLAPVRPDRFARGVPFRGSYAYSIMG